MQYFLYILAIPFLYFNYKIIVSDLKIKKIPNKYLLYLIYLIPFYYIYIFFSFPEINYLLFLWQIFLTFLIWFILYYFNIWAAWDAKYLLVLSLFIPYIWIIPFIWNIALITIFYLFWYFIYFYLWKVLFNKNYRKSLWLNIKQDLSETWKVHKWNKWWNTYKIIAKFLLLFFVIFISIRLSRIYLFNNLLENWNSINYISEIIQKYNIYLIFLLILIFIWGLYLFRILINKFKFYIWEKLNLDLELIWNILIWILFILLASFIWYELVNNYGEISSLLFRVFTIYLWIYLIIKILIYSYKITFGTWEYIEKSIKNLNIDDIINIKDFNKKIMPNLEYKKDLLDYYNIENRSNIILNKYNIKTIKSIVRIINKKDIKFHWWKSVINDFICIKTFAFWIYIFLWFMLTYIYNNLLIQYIIEKISLIFKYFYY